MDIFRFCHASFATEICIIKFNIMKSLKLILGGFLLMTTLVSAKAQEWHNYANFNTVTEALVFNNKTYVTAKGGLLVIDNSTLGKTYYTQSNSALPSNQLEDIETISVSDDVFIGTYDNGIVIMDTDNNMEVVSYPADLGLLYGMKAGPDNNLYLQTSSGGFQYVVANKQFHRFSSVAGSDQWFNAVGFDFSSTNQLVVFTGNNCMFLELPTLNVVDSFLTNTDPVLMSCAPASSRVFDIDNTKSLMSISGYTNSMVFINRDGTTSNASTNLPAFTSIKPIKGTDGQIYALVGMDMIYTLVDTAWQAFYAVPASYNATDIYSETGTTSVLKFSSGGLSELIGINEHTLVGGGLELIHPYQYVFSSNNMKSVFVNDLGDVFTTAADKIYKYLPTTDSWELSQTVPTSFGVLSQVRFINGNIYAYNGNLIGVYADGAWNQIPMAAGFSSDYIFDYDVAPDGTVYFVNDEGLFASKDGTTNLVEPVSGSDFISTVKYDEFRNLLWWGKIGQIVKYDFSVKTTYGTSTAGMPTGMSIQSIAINPANNDVWFGSNNSKVITYNESSGFSHFQTPSADNDFITKICFTNDDKVILVQSDGEEGFYEYDFVNFTRFSTAIHADLVDNKIYDFAVDKEGNYWMAHGYNNGLSAYFKDGTIGISNFGQQSAEIHAYPNPASAQMHIGFNEPIQSIYVYDAVGQLVNANIIPSDKGAVIQTSNLNNGCYFVTVNGIGKKFIVLH